MVRGSGSHNRRNNSNSNSNSNSNRDSRNSCSPSSSSSTATRGGGRRTAAAVAPEPSPRRSRLSSRESSNRESSSSSNQRINQRIISRGSGTRNTRNSNPATGATDRSSTPTVTTRERQRWNHGSGTRSSVEPTLSSSNSSSSSARETQRANHGSGTRNSASTIRTENLSANRGSRTTGTREPRRQQQQQQQRMFDYDVVNPQDAPLYRCCFCLCDIATGIFIAVFGVAGTILCCKLCRKAPTNNDDDDDNSAATTMNHPNRRRGLRNRIYEIEDRMWFSPLWSVFGGMFFSILLFLILIQNSTTTTNFVSSNPSYSGNNIRTMFAGETLRVYVPMLTRSVAVEVVRDPPTSRGTRAALYKSNKVPSLTGPKLELKHDSELDLEGESFVYDYYNLNPGSSVSVWMDQISDGGTYFYLLEGAKALEEIQTGENVDPNHWERIAVTLAHTVGHGHTDSAYVQTSTNNRFSYDNTYTLVYDNQSAHRVSSVDVKTDIVMTTHDLHGYNPACDHMRTGDACHAYATRNDCIILEAFAVREESEEDRLEDGEGDKTISLRIETYRDWKSIAIYSSIPLTISVLIIGGMYLWGCMFYCRSKRNETMIDGNATEPLLSPGDNGLDQGGSGTATADRPPPTAFHFSEESPPVEATAPSEAELLQQPDNVVVIPPESVQVVTK